ncbi:MAG TPA: FtsX-like permease family protein, partial [Rhizobiales bacterium]|nr:FtsX-like permease family protein [Hyphomicrobiales bacterium]
SAARTPASRLFRGAPDATATALPAKRYMAISLMALAGLAGLALVIFPDRLITTWYILGVTGGFVLLSGLGQALKAIARRMPRPKNAVLSLAISSLHRPGAPTTSIILSLGLGLALFVTLALVAGNVSSELKSALPREAPSFFFLDVQNTRLDEFRRFLDTQPGVVKTATAPMLRGKVQKLNGNPVDMKNIAAHVRWAFRGDRGLTYSATIPEGSSLTKGKWWPQDYTGPPLVSFVDEIANGAGLEIGDTVTVNILGRNVTATIASLRKVDWESLRLNFVMVFSPGTLKGAPHTSLVTVTMDKNRTDAAGNEDRLLAAISDKYPAVTAVRIKDALDAVNNLLSKLLTAIRSASALAMMTGILVLAGALSSGLSARIRNAVILKTFGATRRQLIGAFVLEYALTGFITAVFAIAAGSLAAWAIIHFIMEMSWTFSFSTAAVTALAAVILTVPAGLATTWSALAAKPARVLRME